jgi:protocatechuate 4,5-dioxygenase beta chain
MATIIGGVGTSHIPAIGKAIAQALQKDPSWKSFFDGYEPVRLWLDQVRPDVAVVIYNDHGLNFFLNNLPTFAVGAAPEYSNADEGWGLPVAAAYPGHPKLSWHLIESLVADEFDISSCQEMQVDHAFVVPMSLMWTPASRAIRTVPVAINTVQYPYPSPLRCYKFGEAIGRAIRSFDEDLRVLVVGTGGLSHQLEGERAGFINREFDFECLDAISQNPKALTQYTATDLVRLSGSQGIEILNWLAMRGALPATVREIHREYHVPISNTAAATIVLEASAVAAPVSERSKTRVTGIVADSY